MAKIEFLGAGVMGQAMIRNLLRAGHKVCAFNRTIEKAPPLEADGATVAATPREADAVFSMVTDDAASRVVWTGADGAHAAKLRPGALAIESSSVSRDWVLELAALATPRGSTSSIARSPAGPTWPRPERLRCSPAARLTTLPPRARSWNRSARA
jgi:3-hydroxyisobutyrate dehydrogenase-like beta-hydroxyacid dehydrogenase